MSQFIAQIYIMQSPDPSNHYSCNVQQCHGLSMRQETPSWGLPGHKQRLKTSMKKVLDP